MKTTEERDERLLESRYEGRRKWNEEMRECIGKMIQDMTRKKDHQTHHHQEIQLSLSQVCVEGMIDGVEENEREEKRKSKNKE